MLRKQLEEKAEKSAVLEQKAKQKIHIFFISGSLIFYDNEDIYIWRAYEFR